jgi:hypothetical protein
LTDAVSAVRAAEAAFALYAAAECFAGISLNPLEEGVKYAEAAIAALPPGGFPRPDYVRELVEARDWRCLEMISRELDTRAVERSVVPKPAKPRRQHKPRVLVPDGLLTLAQAAGRLGCSIKTLKGHVESGALGYVVIGHGSKRPRKMFTAADLDAFITNQTRKDSPICPSTKTRARLSSTSTSSSEVIAFTARRGARPGARRRR